MKISIEDNHLSISVDRQDWTVFTAVLCLPGRYYNSAKDVWIVPIRLGLADVLKERKYFWSIEPMVRLIEEQLFQQAQQEGQSIDIHSVPAYQALAEAALIHLQTVHFGNITVYNENHPNYKEISNDYPKNRRQKNQVRSSQDAETEASAKSRRKGDEARRRAFLDR